MKNCHIQNLAKIWENLARGFDGPKSHLFMSKCHHPSTGTREKEQIALNLYYNISQLLDPLGSCVLIRWRSIQSSGR